MYVPVHDVIGKIKSVEAGRVGFLAVLALRRGTLLRLDFRLRCLIGRLSMGGSVRGSMRGRMRRGRRFDSSGEGAGCEEYSSKNADALGRASGS